MFCSIIIPTIGRASLERAVRSAVEQDFTAAPYEVIVVNDSGEALPAARWQDSPLVRVIDTNRRERSFARNTGAAIAQGEYFFFLDDDDWMLPGALSAFWEVYGRAKGAAWLFGGIQVRDGDNNYLGETKAELEGNCFAQVMGGAWVPLQSSCIRASTFFAVGGYDPYYRVTQDQDLSRRIAAVGDFASTPVVVGVLLRGSTWKSSTDYSQATEFTRKSRDDVLEAAGMLRRLLASAGSPYWRGRVFHLYASLALWNLRRRRLLRAGSRGLAALVVLLVSGRLLFSRDFREAVGADHVPGALHFIQSAKPRPEPEP